VNSDPVLSEAQAQPGAARIAAAACGFIKGLRRNLATGSKVALFQPTEAQEWRATAGQFLALVLLGLGVELVRGLAADGLYGSFNFAGLPRAVWFVPLVLLAGYLVSVRESAPPLVLGIAVLFAAVSVPYDIAFGALDVAIARGWAGDEVEQGAWPTWARYALYALWVVALCVGVLRLTRPGLLRAASHLATLLAVVIVPLWAIPSASLWLAPGDDDEPDDDRDSRALSREDVFYAQPALLAQELQSLEPQRPGIDDLYFVGVAGDGSQDVFMKELRVVSDLFRERFDADGRSVMLVNNPATVRELPIATATALDHALARVGRTIDPEEDVVFLYITSHGSEDHRLAMQFWPLQLRDLRPGMIKRMLDEAGIKWRVIAISACYSGGFIEPLKDDNTLIVTAADSDHTSFGCGNDSDLTYFGKAYFDHALRGTWSFVEAFEQARREIEGREKAQALTPSNPQMVAGTQILRKLEGLRNRLRLANGVIEARAPDSSASAFASAASCAPARSGCAAWRRAASSPAAGSPTAPGTP
jgi:hypothetical protein